jgi:hypothetical protein
MVREDSESYVSWYRQRGGVRTCGVGGGRARAEAVRGVGFLHRSFLHRERPRPGFYIVLGRGVLGCAS